MLSTQFLYLTSENRLDGTSSDCVLALDINAAGKFDRCVVTQLSIPLSYYLIREPYNNMILREKEVDTTITIPKGNYDARTFATVLTDLLNSNSPNGWVYEMELDIVLAKYTYRVTGNDEQPSFIISNHLGSQTGFDLDSTNTFDNNVLVSENVISFVSTNSLFLRSNLVNSSEDILQEVYSSNTIPYSFITYQCTDVELYSKPINKDENSGICTFRLTDEHGNVVDLNGHDWNITLKLYKSVPYGEMWTKLITELQDLK